MLPPGQGDRIGRYELRDRLGAGAAGEVWEAVLHGPEGFRRAVAVKLLHVGPDGAEGARALVREARLGAGLQHPNLVAVHDLGEADGRWYVAMELVTGASLAAAAAEAPLPPAAVLDAGIQVCAGLAHLHELGVVHRDLKPANLLLDRYGVVKVADLGVARLAREAGAAAGTPGFMPPEQALGEPVDARADLFALGVTLYRLAVGTNPFGTGVRALMAVTLVEDRLREGLVEPAEAAVPGLGAILHRCLRLAPADRWPAAGALADALAVARARIEGPDLRDVLARIRPDLRAAGTASGPPSTRSRRDDPATVAFAPGNLPAPRDRFVGRDADVAAISSLVRSGERLVSLLGPGGTGKTRLALAAARELAPDLPGGAWFFDLSAARRADEVCALVAGALGVSLDRGDAVHQLGRVLAFRGRCAVVLDNLEQAVDAVGELLPRWQQLAPDAAFLATSRVALRLTGERRVAVGPLDRDAGVDLFVERAPRPPSVAERPEVEALVAELDGLPLAIELAAARTRVLGIRKIRARLADRFAFLVDGDRDRPERQRSLQASLDVSWALLSPRAQRALAQLSVFAAAATMDAAEQVVDLGGDHVLDALEELADASLVRVDADGERFRTLLMVREYARLQAPREAEGAEIRHGAVFAAFGRPDALALVEGPSGLERSRELVAALEDLVAACVRAVARGDAPVATRTFLAAGEGLLLRGPVGRIDELANGVLGLPLDDPSRLRVLHLRGYANLAAGRFDAALEGLDAALALAVSLGDAPAEARIRARLAWRASLAGDRAGAEAEVVAAIAAADRRPDPRVQAAVLRDAGSVAWAAGRHEEAARLLADAARRFRATGDLRGLAGAAMNLGLVEFHRSRYAEARVHLAEADALHRRSGDRRNGGLLRVNLGTLAFQTGRPDEARAHFVEACRLLAEVGDGRNHALAQANLGLALREVGRFAEAEGLLHRALVAQESLGDDRAAVLTLWHLGTLAGELGRRAESRAHLEDARSRAQKVGLDRATRQLDAKLALNTLEDGDPEGGLAAVALAAEASRAAADVPSVVQALAIHGAMLVRLGRAAEARPMLDEATALAGGELESQLAFAALVGEARVAAGDPGGSALLDRAVSALRAGGYRVGLAEALLGRARARGEAADRVEAEEIVASLGLPAHAPLRQGLRG